MNFIDRFLNNITMYRLVMYYLIVLLAIAAIFGAFGILPYNPIAIIFSTLFLGARRVGGERHLRHYHEGPSRTRNRCTSRR